MIIDIRKNEDYLKGHIPGAIHIPYSSLIAHPEKYLDKSKSYQLYCNSGKTSLNLVLHLNQKGYHCVNIEGGYTKYLFDSFYL